MVLSFNKACVVGATGPTGKFLSRELLRRELAVRVVSRTDSSLARAFDGASGNGLERVAADMLVPDTIPRAFEGCDLIFDCIGLPMDRIEDHPRTAQNIAQSIEKCGARCVHVSSYWPYIPLQESVVNESHPRREGILAARMRREAEDILQSAGAAIAELPDFYGPEVHTSVLQQALEEAVAGKTVNWIGSADTSRENIYVPDAMNAVAELASHEPAYGERWLVPGAGPISLRKIRDIVEKHLGRPIKVRTAGWWTLRLVSLFSTQAGSFMPLVPTYLKPIRIDGSNLTALIGRVPVTPHEEAIPKTLDWLLDRGISTRDHRGDGRDDYRRVGPLTGKENDNMTELKESQCVPCKGGEPPLEDKQIDGLRDQVPDWNVSEENGQKRLRKSFDFDDFKQALDFTLKVGNTAEEQGHHPQLVTEWGKVTVRWWTHKIGGLHRNDFVMAARTDEILESN